MSNGFGNIYKASWWGDSQSSKGFGLSYSLYRKRVLADNGIIEVQRSLKKDKTIFF